MASSRRVAMAATLSTAAASLLLAALVLSASDDRAALVLATRTLCAGEPCQAQRGVNVLKPASLEDAPLTWNEDGSISADTVRQWRDKAESAGAFPMPDKSFFDPTNSDVWTDQTGASSAEKETSWLKPGKWVADRRGSASHQRDIYADDHHSEYQDGNWWPYELGVGPSQEAKMVKEAEDKKAGAADSWKDIYHAMVRRYNNPTFDPYMEQEYRRLVVAPNEAVRAHAQGHTPRPADAAVGGKLESAQDAVHQLDREAARAMPAMDAIFRDLPSKGLPGEVAWPEKWPSDGGITHGVFRKFNPRAGMMGGEGEPKSWEDVAAANSGPSMPLSLPGDGLVEKEYKKGKYSSPPAPLGYVDTHEQNFVQDW